MNKRELWDLIGGLPCVVTGSGEISIHHCQGGSMREALAARGLDGTKGMGLRGYSDALVIPLHPRLHYIGPDAIDGGIGRRAWELRYGRQCDHLDSVGDQLGFDLWALHADWTQQSGYVSARTTSRRP